MPYVVETSVGLDRLFLSILSSALKEEVLEGGDTRTVLSLPYALAPYKAAIFPLVKKDGLPELAEKIMKDLKFDFMLAYDEKDTVGKRYRRQDEIGTPYCITVDFETLNDQAVTVRHRDKMTQERVPMLGLNDYIRQALKTWSAK